MIRRLIILLLIVGATTLQAKNFGYYLLMSTKEDYKNSVFPGGYLGFGISIGKNNQNKIYWDTQITGSIQIISKNTLYWEGGTFAGITLGRRITNTKRMIYFDFQANIFYPAFIQMGYGRGWMFYEQKRIPRGKLWLGLPLPIIITFDKYMLNEELVKHKGLMFTLPLPIYGKTFYPG